MEEREERERQRIPEEPDEFEDEEPEGFDEPGVSRGRLRVVLLGVLLLAAVGGSLFYLRGWWSRPFLRPWRLRP